MRNVMKQALGQEPVLRMTGNPELVEIPLTRGLVALIDSEDYDRLSQHNWYASRCATGKFYARRNINVGKRDDGTTVRSGSKMHREVMYAPPGQPVDHINGNTLDNRKGNLRFCTPSQNCRNKDKICVLTTSQYKGVNWHSGKWRAYIKIKQKQISLGHFLSEIDAAIAYDNAARKHFGEFAWLNFPSMEMAYEA